MSPVSMSQLYRHQHISNYLASTSFAMYVAHQPVPVLHASTTFPIIWLTLVLPCISSVVGEGAGSGV